MRFGVLGPLVVWTDRGQPVRVPQTKVRALLADLLIHHGRPVSVDRLIDDLWGAAPPGNPTNTLQTKVSQLRRALDRAQPGGRDLVVSSPSGYLLRVGADAVDAERFAALVTRAAGGDARSRAATLAEALDLWRGAAYADVADEDFARPAIARLEELRLVAVEQRAEARLEMGEHAVLAGELGEVVDRYPLRERLRAAHLRALYRAGRQSEALDSYARLRARLADELGLDPGPELVALQRAMLTRDPALDPVPPPGVPPWPAGNLPAAVTALIGRDEAVTELRSVLRDERLLTLTGPGGVGKTRLALEVGAGLADAFRDGVWLVELAAQDPPAGTQRGYRVAAAIMSVLDIRDAPSQEPDATVRRLGDAVRERELLLVLDNCEHLVEEVADVVQRLLRANPRLRVLSTSREPLRVAGEVVRDVPPLPVPDPAEAPEPERLMRSAAVRLFVTLVAAAMPGFAVDRRNAQPVAMLCRRLDGLPLALELAANRVRGLGIDEVVARLDDRFRLLSAGHRGAPPRQRTLTAVIDWSWRLLTDEERQVLRRLAVHTGGCTLEAAEAVCAAGGTGAGLPGEVAPAEVADVLARLVDRSLVVLDDRTGDPARYRLLESVWAYCRQRLYAAEEFEQVRDRHERYYAGLADRAESHLYGADQRRWLRRLDAEATNLRDALDGATRGGHADRAVRMANALAWYWFLRGRLAEARRSLEQALAAVGSTSAEARARALAWHTGIRCLQGDTSGWVQRLGECVRRYRDVDDPGGQARAEWFLSFAVSDFGDPSTGEDLARRALATLTKGGDRWGMAAASSTLAKYAAQRGDLGAVRAGAERSLAIFRELGDRWGQLQATEWLGELAEIGGDYRRAAALHEEALAVAEDLGLWPEAADRLSWLGRIAMLRGDHPQARRLCERARALAAEQGYQPGQTFAEITLGLNARREGALDAAEAHLRTALARDRHVSPVAGVAHAMAVTELGFVAEQRGDPQAARVLHLDGLTTARALGDARAVALALEGLAGAEALARRYEQAARLLGTAHAARQTGGVPLPAAERADVDRITTAVREGLGEAGYAREFRAGTRLSPEQAVPGPPAPSG